MYFNVLYNIEMLVYKNVPLLELGICFWVCVFFLFVKGGGHFAASYFLCSDHTLPTKLEQKTYLFLLHYVFQWQKTLKWR